MLTDLGSKRSPAAAAAKNDEGFSLVELLIAMVVTLIVSGAIYGLLASGQSAFRREPLMTDRQQNIRVAMNMIQTDIGVAGSNLPPFIQAFTRGDGANQGNPLLNARGPNLVGQPSDFVQIYGNDGYCPSVPVDPIATGSGGVNGANVYTASMFPDCFGLPAMVGVGASSGSFMLGIAEYPGGGGGGPSEDHINFPNGQQPQGCQCNGSSNCNPANDCPPDDAQFIVPIQLVRYEIALGTDGMPNLWRSTTGGVNPSNGNYTPASANPNTAGRWQLVARGIEDLQVQYIMADSATPENSPDVVLTPAAGVPAVLANYNTLVRSVRVTLSARSERAREAGITTVPSPGAPQAFRGQLTTLTTPRQVLATLTAAPGLLTWR